LRKGSVVSDLLATQSKDEQIPTLSNIVFGRFMLPDMSEHPCQVTSITRDGAVFVTASIPSPGLAVVAYLEELGRIEAVSGEAVDKGFKVTFTASGARRERLNARIDWLQKKKVGDSEARRHARYEPREKQSQITMGDGRIYPCEVMDISISGAAIKSDVIPSVGTYLMLGRMMGKVVRYIDQGVGIEFVKQLEKSTLSNEIEGPI
jgi:hypothetical protein